MSIKIVNFGFYAFSLVAIVFSAIGIGYMIEGNRILSASNVSEQKLETPTAKQEPVERGTVYINFGKMLTFGALSVGLLGFLSHKGVFFKRL